MKNPNALGLEARGRGGLGQGPMALKRLKQTMATLSADRRRDIYIFIAAFVFLTVVYLLTRWLA
jgi:hypothetical protein